MTIYRIEVYDPYTIRYYDIQVPDCEGSYYLAQAQAHEAYLDGIEPALEEGNDRQSIDFGNGSPCVEPDELPSTWNSITRQWDYFPYESDYNDGPWPDYPVDMTKLIQYNLHK
jgi:hypothetical protein